MKNSKIKKDLKVPVKVKAGNKIKASKEQKKATKKAISSRKKTISKKPVNKIEGKVGRPSILTPELINKISKLILSGSYIETACAACGFSKKLYYEWLKLGAKRKNLLEYLENSESDGSISKKEKKEIEASISNISQIYQQFSDAIEKAVTESEIRDVIRIDQAAQKSWQAAAWKLERKFPERWSRYNRVEHSGEIESNNNVSIDVTRNTILQLIKDQDTLALAEQLIDKLNLMEPESD